MDKMMDHRWSLRIIALLLAIFLFYTVQLEKENAQTDDNGTMTETLESIPLEVYYDNENLTVTGLPETVDLYITGPASIVQPTRQIKDFTLFVDLRNLPMGQHQVRIQTENLSERLGVRIEPSMLTVSIEEKVTKEFRIDPELNEQLLAEGYVLEEISVDPGQVKVTGPRSVIDSISFVKATVTGEAGINESFTAESTVRVLANDLTKLENVTIEPETVRVDVGIEAYSKELPVTIEQTGTLADGITVNSLTPSFETVTVYGPRSVVDPLTEYVLEVNVGSISAADTEIQMDAVLPEGVVRIDPEQIDVEAEIEIDEAVLPEEPNNPEVEEDLET
ncbi:YbbR-like domain-containing protein [Planomicrobium sp. YIM 101495]|uniref:CdaR family protein n=1 Tax=Planomicrobium sp. YIM 101495 TaxID=2665160 RepID=UPI0012B9F6D3|nr:CdaR family protein [Planomicrobium sp. YIM 101495]MTD31237.1 hypothetical protein [Planomicrobium sp. YIM 101495]